MNIQLIAAIKAGNERNAARLEEKRIRDEKANFEYELAKEYYFDVTLYGLIERAVGKGQNSLSIYIPKDMNVGIPLEKGLVVRNDKQGISELCYEFEQRGFTTVLEYSNTSAEKLVVTWPAASTTPTAQVDGKAAS